MSGLVTFFKAFLPSKGADSNNASDPSYNDTLLGLVETTSADTPQAVEPPTNTTTMSQWREERIEILRGFMESRMIQNDKDNEDDRQDHDDTSYEVPDNDEFNVPFWDGSQGTTIINDMSGDMTAESLSLSTRKRIPHVDETLHVSKTLASLDLYTKEFHLPLAKLVKAWTLRDINRRQWKSSTRFEDDGPLGTLFKHVLCVEVEQLVLPSPQPSFGVVPQHLRIFCYNKYATQVNAFLSQQHPSHILVSIEHVPAKSILPLRIDDASWFDAQKLSPYCLCIGDKSSMKIDDGGQLQKIRFDSPQLKITLCRVSAKDGVDIAEVDISPTTVGNMTLIYKEKPTLESHYQEWETAIQQYQQQQVQEEKKDDESSTDAGVPDANNNNKVRRASDNDGPDAKRAKKQVTYHTLAEIRDLFEAHKGKGSSFPMINLYGVVLGFTAPTLTKGHDWLLNIALVDPSTPLPKGGGEHEEADDSVAATTVCIFCRERDKLPHIVKAGDVLRLHRVAAQEWKGEIQLLGKRASSYVVVRPPDSNASAPIEDWTILPTASDSTSFGKEDKERAISLWRWAKTRLASHPTIKPSTKMRLSDLTRQDQRDYVDEKSGDLTVMISSILPVPEGLRTTNTPLGYIRVWDGTGAPTSDPMPIASAEAGAALRNGDPPSQALQSISLVIEELKEAKATDDVASLEPPTCLCGRVSNVAVWEVPHWELVTNVLRVGSFVRLRNVYETRMHDGLRCLMIQSKSGMTPLPYTTYEIKELLKEHQQRVLRKEPFNPQSGVLPLEGEAAPAVATPVEAAHAPVPMDADDIAPVQVEAQRTSFLARCKSQTAPCSIAGKFRVVKTIPSGTEGPYGLRRLCLSNEQGTVFRFAVLLCDEAGEQLDAIVTNDIGESMFQMSASDAFDIPTEDSADVLRNISREGTWWNGEIKCVEMNGQRFFILTSLSTA